MKESSRRNEHQVFIGNSKLLGYLVIRPGKKSEVRLPIITVLFHEVSFSFHDKSIFPAIFFFLILFEVIEKYLSSVYNYFDYEILIGVIQTTLGRPIHCIQ